MNQQIKQVEIIYSHYYKVRNCFAIDSLFQYRDEAICPIKCPFDYLFALKPKNPV